MWSGISERHVSNHLHALSCYMPISTAHFSMQDLSCRSQLPCVAKQVVPVHDLIAAQVLPDEDVGEVGAQALQQPIV